MKARPDNHLLRLVLLAALAPVAACTSFEEVSTVLDLRVLAIETDPSEVILKVDGLPEDLSMPFDYLALTVDPASIPVIHVTPLVVLPPASADRAITWRLAACPNNPNGAGPPAGGGGGPDPSGGARTTVGSTLCPADPTKTWELGAGVAGGSLDVTFTPDQLRTAFLSDIYFDQYKQPHGGFDLGLPMNLELTATDGVDTVQAVKRVLFWAQMLPGQVPNKLPSVPAISTYADRDETTWEPIGDVTPLDPLKPIHVALGSQLWLSPDLPKDDAEKYVTTVIDRNEPHRAMPVTVPRERIRFAFYATAGHFNPPRSVNEVTPGISGTVHLESKYTPPATLDDVPADAAGDHLVTIWVVVRDDRGGEKWLEARIALDP